MHRWLFTGVLISWICLNAQEAPISARRLERWRELGQYERICSAYEHSPHSFTAAHLLLVANAYAHLGNSSQALALYRQAAAAGTVGWAPEHWCQYARLLHQSGEVDRAAHFYRLCAEHGSGTVDPSLHLAQLTACKNLKMDPSWKPEPIAELNTYGPVYATWWTGTQLYAVSRSPALGAPVDREGIPYERIVPRNTVSYRYHQAVIGNLGDTLLLYLSKGKGNIYFCVPTPTGWSRPKRWRTLPHLPSGRPSLAFDPKTGDVYFTHDPGLHVPYGRDIYRCRYLGEGKYSNPERLPAPLNTPYNEDAPFIVEDTLYFASNGPTSAGGYDVFYAVRIGERDWGPPQPMPAPINSCANDIYFYPFSAQHTYLSSDREGTFRVYRVQYVPPPAPPAPEPEPVAVQPPPPPVPRFAIAGRLLHHQTRGPLPGRVILVDSATQREVLGQEITSDGRFRLSPPRENTTYYLYAQSVGYMTYVQVIRTPPALEGAEPTSVDILLMPIEMEAIFALRNIYFDFNSDKLKPESIPELERLRRLLQENPNIRIRFSGHTDNIGSDAYNKALSERRARAVLRWLREHGIHPVQMEYIGYGKTRPVAPNTTEEGRALNRRIEMEIVGIRALESTNTSDGSSNRP